MGDVSSDNVTTLRVAVQNSGVNANRLALARYQSDTGPGYIVTLSPISETDPCYYSSRKPAGAGEGSPGGGNSKDIYMGTDGITKLYVKLSDLNHYNENHRLGFTWDDDCHLILFLMVESE